MLTDWERRLAETMLSDRHRLRQQLRQLREAEKAKRPCEPLLAKLEAEFRRSIQRRESRAASVPKFEFGTDLPILARRADIEAAIREHPVVIVCGETGSGKSTQLPKLCLSLGRGVSGLIGHTQPRRVAARTIAARVADELKTTLGTTVGFKVRFTDATQPNTLIKLMTDGVLLAETRSDRFLDQYDTIIVDEAHERSLNIDFLLGYLKRLLPRRPDLKVIITSATIDAARFAEHFGTATAPAPILEVSGRMYPVDIRWRGSRLGLCPDPNGRDGIPTYEMSDDPQRAILDAVDELAAENLWDMLSFQRGRDDQDVVETSFRVTGQNDPSDSRIDRQSRQLAAEFRQLISIVDRAEFKQCSVAVTNRRRLRRFKKRKLFQSSQIQRLGLQNHGRKIRPHDFWRSEFLARRKILFVEEPNANARCDASASSRSLIGRRLRDRLDRQPLHLATRRVPTDARGSGVDHRQNSRHG